MIGRREFIKLTQMALPLVLAGFEIGLFPGAAFAESPLAPEKNPPGDIPDTQVFVDYASPGHFTLKVPEGWARTDGAGTVSFADKLDGVSVTLTPAAQAPTIDAVKAEYVSAMLRDGRAVEVASVTTRKLPAGPAILIAYTLNSEPNAVTNKQIRLEANRYLLFRDGELATLDLYAPQGADNVDQWQLMSRSFQWQ